MSFRDMCLKAAPAGELARGKMEGSVSEKVRFPRHLRIVQLVSVQVMRKLGKGRTYVFYSGRVAQGDRILSYPSYHCQQVALV